MPRVPHVRDREQNVILSIHEACQSDPIHLAAMMIPLGLEKGLEKLHAVLAASSETSSVICLHPESTLPDRG